MHEVLQTSAAQMVIGFSGLLMLTVIGVYVVLKFRDHSDGIENSAALLTKFREMRREGHINESEYRHIKTDLEAKLSKQSSPKIADSDVFDMQG